MRLTWDAIGERYYEAGDDQCVFYPIANNAYPMGYAWNGVTGITQSPSGAEAKPIYADNRKYLNLRGAEEYGCTLTAYDYPDEFAECDGSAQPVPGVYIGQQSRKMFGICYRTKLGNDVDGNDHAYKLHLVYGLTASPSERAYATINDSPEPMEMSWKMDSTPVEITGYKSTSIIEISSKDFSSAQMQALEDILYGTVNTDPRLPLPDEVVALMGTSIYEIVLDKANATVKTGKTVVLNATVSPSTQAVTWESSDTDKATVANGVVTGVAAGTVTITAKFTVSGTTYSDTCSVKVTAA